MTETALQFAESDRLGRVSAVDTSKVLIDVEDSSQISRAGIGNLVAILGSTESEYLIGITERITRTLRDELIDDDEEGEVDSFPMGPTTEDILRVLLIGTFRTVFGDKSNVFKRGADSFPQIDRECFLIEGGNLQRFMGFRLFSTETRLERVKNGAQSMRIGSPPGTLMQTPSMPRRRILLMSRTPSLTFLVGSP